MSDLLYCIGDSHASFFAGENTIQPKWPERSVDRLPYFRSYRIGAVLAYNLCKTGTTMRGRENLFEVLESDVQAGGRLLLCFGEIDCRAHLLKQSHQQKRPITRVVNECVDRYFSVIHELQDSGYSLHVWGVIPSTRYIVENVELPTYGSPGQRNHVTRLFNRYLAQRCAADGIPFISIFDNLIDQFGRTRMEYYMDNVHLSQRAMPLAVAALKSVTPDIDFERVDLSIPHYELPNQRAVMPSPPRFPTLAYYLAGLKRRARGIRSHIIAYVRRRYRQKHL